LYFWLDVFDSHSGHNAKLVLSPEENLRHVFNAADGDQYPASFPDPELVDEIEFVPKLKLKLKQGPSGGGCR